MKMNPDNIRELRDRTGLGLSDCKKALEECDGDIKKAVDKLRTIGLAKADKKSDRVASDGLVAMCLTENYGALVELNCETDFVARNEKFIELVSNLASIAHQERCISVDELKNAKYESIGTVQEAIMNGTSVLGEKLELSKLCYLETKDGVVAGYVHGDVRGLGKTGALVALQSPGDKAKLQEIGKQIAMHIVAMKPEALSIDDLDQMKLKNERSIIEEQVRSLNKPEEVAKKIVDGRMAKYYEEVVLLEQKFIKDDKMKVSDFIKSSEVSAIKLSDYKLLVWAVQTKWQEMSSLADKVKYSRVLLKISGEALMGSQSFGHDMGIISQLCKDIADVNRLGVQVCIVVGGGNIFRGASASLSGCERASSDYIGMLATIINALILQNFLEKNLVASRVLSAIPMATVCEPYIRRKAIRHLEKGRVVIFAAGTGNPFFTTDTAAALRAVEMNCDVILKGTQVNGVYSADPKKNEDAVMYDRLSYTDLLTRDLKVMDASAISLARENSIPIIVFSLKGEKIVNIIKGQGTYTIVSDCKQ